MENHTPNGHIDIQPLANVKSMNDRPPGHSPLHQSTQKASNDEVKSDCNREPQDNASMSCHCSELNDDQNGIGDRVKPLQPTLINDELSATLESTTLNGVCNGAKSESTCTDYSKSIEADKSVFLSCLSSENVNSSQNPLPLLKDTTSTDLESGNISDAMSDTRQSCEGNHLEECESSSCPATDSTELSESGSHDDLKSSDEVGGLRYCVYESELQMPDVIRLMTADLSEPYSIYTYRYFIHNWPQLCFLTMDKDFCVGAIVCKLDVHKRLARRGYIAMLAVDHGYRRKGVGSALVSRAIKAMVQEGCDEVVLETEITNKGALRLYENLGFVRDKRLFRYYLNGVDALRLKLWLR